MSTFDDLHDDGVLELIGTRVRKERLNQNLTQQELADRTGLNRIVLTRLEGGAGCTLGSFIRILRALGKLDQIDLFLPEPGVSPLQLARFRGRERKEASGRRGQSKT